MGNEVESGKWYRLNYDNSNGVTFYIPISCSPPQCFEVDNVIFQDELKTTIVIWKDGTKTVVHCMKDDEFVPEVGFAMALAKKIYGDRGSYLKIIKESTHQKVYKK